MPTPRTPAAPRRLLRAFAIALALGGAACSREVEVTVVVDSAPLLDKPSMDAIPAGAAEMGKRLLVRVPRYGKKPFWAVKDAKTFVKADEVAPFPVAGSLAFVSAERLTVTGPAGSVAKELRLGSPVRTFSNAVLADRQLLAVVEDGVVVGFCDPAGVSTEKPPASLFTQRVHEMVRAGDFDGAKKFVDGGLTAYPGEASLKPWGELLRRAAEPLAFPPPGQRVAVPPDPPVKSGALAYVAPLAAAVLGEPRADAKPLTVVRQNTPLKVVDAEGAFAKVQLAETDAVAWAPFLGQISFLPDRLPERYRAPEAEPGGAAVTAAGAEAVFHVRLVDLQGAPSTEESLVARAKQAQAAGKPDEALELLSRALGLGDAEPETYEALFDGAIAAGDLERAAWAAVMARTKHPPIHALRGAAGWSEPAIVDVALVQGCHAPLQPGGAVETVALRSTLRRPKPGGCLVLMDSTTVCEDCTRDQESAFTARKHEEAANQKFVEAAEELYPLGPFLRITVANTSFTAGPPRAPLFVTYGKAYWVPLLALGAYERVTLYVKIDTYRDVYGVSLGEEDAGDPDEAGAGGTFVVEAPETATVWVGQEEPECEECERDGDAMEEGGDVAEEDGGDATEQEDGDVTEHDGGPGGATEEGDGPAPSNAPEGEDE